MELTGETKDWGRGMAEAFSMVQDQAPLVHMIANYVTASFCADAMAAMGARPLMAQAPEEMEEITGSADGLAVNLGQPSEEKYLGAGASDCRKSGAPGGPGSGGSRGVRIPEKSVGQSVRGFMSGEGLVRSAEGKQLRDPHGAHRSRRPQRSGQCGDVFPSGRGGRVFNGYEGEGPENGDPGDWSGG